KTRGEDDPRLTLPPGDCVPAPPARSVAEASPTAHSPTSARPLPRSPRPAPLPLSPYPRRTLRAPRRITPPTPPFPPAPHPCTTRRALRTPACSSWPTQVAHLTPGPHQSRLGSPHAPTDLDPCGFAVHLTTANSHGSRFRPGGHGVSRR